MPPNRDNRRSQVPQDRCPVFIDHLVLNRARAGGNSRTPLGVESFAENLIVALMGAAMLFGR